MSLVRIKIENYKSIKCCDIKLTEMNLLIGENGSGKSNILEAINYFYNNLTNSREKTDIFDENNRFSNEVLITLTYDLSEFVKIAKANGSSFDELELLTSDMARYRGYYKAIIALASGKKDRKISLKMSQIKGMPIKWNYSYEDRQLLKSLFPIFHIDSRNLDVKEWDYIWDMLGELAKVSNRERKKLETAINTFLLNSENAIEKKLQRIVDVFNGSNISVNRTTSKNFAKQLTQVFFSGEEIYQKGKTLGYYSTGTNSVKYIEVLLRSIDELAKTKLKEPIILMDEPEISLHNQFIDELSSALCMMTSRANILMATHSSRLTKNLIIGLDDVTLYNVKLVEKYTNVYRMKRFVQYSPKSKYRVTDDHINAYFSKAVLFVEGETELELFSNPYLKALFPMLEKIDVYQAISQEPILNIMNPKSVGTRIPYILLVDMDKAISYDTKKNKLSLKTEYIKENKKECLQYRNKKETSPYLYHQHKRLMAASEKLKIKYYLPFYSCSDVNYYEFLTMVKEYLKRYNIFAFNSTIEGALINERTFDFVIDFLQKKSKAEEFEAFKTILQKYHPNDRINLLRYTFKGKSDLLQQKKINNTSFVGKDAIQRIQKPVGKASGWVSEYMDVFFARNTELWGNLSIKNFRKYLVDDEKRKILELNFRYYFPELSLLIDYIYDTIN